MQILNFIIHINLIIGTKNLECYMSLLKNFIGSGMVIQLSLKNGNSIVFKCFLKLWNMRKYFSIFI